MFKYVYNDLDIAHKFDKIPMPSSDYTKHYHDFYEVFFLVSGDIIYTVEEEKKALSSNSILFIRPGDHHFVTFISDTPYERYVLKFAENLVPEFLKEFFFKRSAFYPVTDNILAKFEKLDEQYNFYNSQELQLLVPCFITELLIELGHLEPQEKVAHSEDDDSADSITAIIQYINQNLREPLTVDDLCDKFHFSPSYLYTKFHKHMKIPIMKYIRSKKIIAAHQTILRGEKPTKVAEMFGYLDYTTFYRTFVSVMGFSPSHNKK